MNPFDIEIPDASNQKIVIGVRCLPDLKGELIRESKNLDISLSEYCENILLNRDQVLSDKGNYSKQISELQDRIDTLEYEKESLYSKMGELTSQPSIFKNLRLLELFQTVKGKKDLIVTENGDKHEVIYNEPKDLLEAMIYSFKCKKP
jgi:hypothetical protein